MIFVSNSGPLISFARSNQLELLRQVLQEIKIPEAVYEEIVVQGGGKPGAKKIDNQEWIIKKIVKDQSKVEQLPTNLGIGEREAIVLAQEFNAAILIDERLARREAEKMGIIYFDSLRVLKEAKIKGLIREVNPIGDELRKTGLRIKDSLYQQFLQEMGE